MKAFLQALAYGCLAVAAFFIWLFGGLFIACLTAIGMLGSLVVLLAAFLWYLLLDIWKHSFNKTPKRKAL